MVVYLGHLVKSFDRTDIRDMAAVENCLCVFWFSANYQTSYTRESTTKDKKLPLLMGLSSFLLIE